MIKKLPEYYIYQKWDQMVARPHPMLDLVKQGYIEIALIPREDAVINQIDHYALENSNHKLAEANARIVEFEDIKRRHLEFQEELINENVKFKEALAKIRDFPMESVDKNYLLIQIEGFKKCAENALKGGEI